MRIGVIAAGSPLEAETARRVSALAASLSPQAELRIHPASFDKSGHFAGADEARRAAFVAYANDPSLDAIWFGRGGYGACRIAEDALAELTSAARGKLYLGYSDAGFLLAGLYKAGFRVAHGPMASDIKRDGGEDAVKRALRYIVEGARDGLEPALDSRPAAAFNITILSALIGTPLEPDLSGHVLMLEDVSEHMYRIDRALFHIFAAPQMRTLAGVRLGRISDVLPNDPDFELSEEAIIKHWCARAGVAYLGRADIGHDAANKIVPFGAR